MSNLKHIAKILLVLVLGSVLIFAASSTWDAENDGAGKKCSKTESVQKEECGSACSEAKQEGECKKAEGEHQCKSECNHEECDGKCQGQCMKAEGECKCGAECKHLKTEAEHQCKGGECQHNHGIMK